LIFQMNFHGLTTLNIFDQELGIWLMECVGYDNDFQLELCDKFPRWVPPPRNPKGSGKKSSSKKSSPKKTQVAGRKRKREDSESLDSDDNRRFAAWGEDFDLSDSEDEDEVPTYRPRGTRSRPICL
jgi:hypothetical protein